eukprot:g5628.t1
MGCTGTLISNKVIATAAHCVYDCATSNWQPWPISFTPGQDNSERPYGTKSVWKMTVPALSSFFILFAGCYTSCSGSACSNCDYARLVLSETLNLGYPQSKNQELWYDSCPINGDSGDYLTHKCDTEPGNSGSGIYKISAGGRYLIAVHDGSTGS